MAVGVFLAVTAQAAEECPAMPSLPPPTLPHLRAAQAIRQPLVIVAFGSSSTQGWMSSDPAHAYPAILQRELELRLPGSAVSVLNRGIGGQDAGEELARLDTDVIAVRPQLVIWQVGANGALRDTSPETFRRLVSAGVAKLKAAGIDTVLMDNQRSPRVLRAPDHVAVEAALAEVATETGASLFSRGRLMDAWKASGHPYEDFVAADALHMNDLGYACLARGVADAIVEGLRQTPVPGRRAIRPTAAAATSLSP
jgi:acyl-CoA thioesterase I